MKKKMQIERHYAKWGYIFATPFVAAFLIFHLWPMATTFLYAFCDLKHTVITDNPPLLVSEGLPWYKNFKDLFATKTIVSAFKNTFFFWIAQTIPEWILAFWLAAMMTDRRLKVKGRWLFKTAFFFPNLMTGSSIGYLVLGNIIGFIGTTAGIVITAAMIDGFKISATDLEFFTSDRFFIIMVSIFMHFGITFIYAVVGMTSIPVEIFEAAEMDGSSRLNTFFRITLPCMRPIMFFIVIVTVVDGLGMADIPSIVGNPFDAQRRTVTLQLYLDNLLGMGNAWDRASAFCLIMLGLSVAISGLIYFTLIRDRYETKLARRIRKEKRMQKLLAEQ
jgi:multiple sugar transport system permease protein